MGAMAVSQMSYICSSKHATVMEMVKEVSKPDQIGRLEDHLVFKYRLSKTRTRPN